MFDAVKAWGAIKEAALSEGETLVEGLSHVALAAWSRCDAGTKLSADRPTREAFAASLVGAAIVDTALDKLAAEGTYTPEEHQFLKELNAEAALTDLAEFTKNASTLEALLSTIKKNPALVGAGAGAVAGAGFGAYADDNNRLRGALRFALPGAATGALLGNGASQLHAESLAKAK